MSRGRLEVTLGDPARMPPRAYSADIAELRMWAALHDASATEAEDPGGDLSGRQPVRDHHRRTPGEQPFEGSSRPDLRLRVAGAPGLVEHQQVGAGEVRAR